jgi:hypothetical protein
MGFGQLAVRYTTELGRAIQNAAFFFLFSFIPGLPLGSCQFLEEVEDIIRLKEEAVWGLGLL